MTEGRACAWPDPKLVVDDGRFIVHGSNGWVIFRYLADGGAARPHLATICGPSGRNMVEDAPVDHLHHHGVWWGHGDVNGVDYYLELPGSDGPANRGRVEHVGWRHIVDAPPRFGFVEDVAWRDHLGNTVITETRSVALHLVDERHLTIDLASTYMAQVDLAFGDTKESVLPGIRIAEALSGALGGTISNSRGGIGERDTFGLPAEWVDVSGARTPHNRGEPLVEGIACFDHPANPGHPTRWFTRAYGPVSPFSGHHFYEDRALPAGDTLRLRHRLVVHLGDAAQAELDKKYQAYCEEEHP